jgi:hypothetical protein
MSLREKVSEIPPDVELVAQQTIDPPNVEKWMLKVEAPSKFAARRRARAVTRTTVPTAKNVLDPKALDRREAKQSELRDFFPKSWHAEEFAVEVVVVK